MSYRRHHHTAAAAVAAPSPARSTAHGGGTGMTMTSEPLPPPTNNDNDDDHDHDDVEQYGSDLAHTAKAAPADRHAFQIESSASSDLDPLVRGISGGSSGGGFVGGGGEASTMMGDEDIQESEWAALDEEQRMQVERHRRRVQHWRDHPFATGLVPMTWRDEKERNQHHRGSRQWFGDKELETDETGCLCCTTLFCPRMGRVGNMIVIRSSPEWIEEVEVTTAEVENGNHNSMGEEKLTRRYMRPKLDCVIGPYWPMMVFVTYPLILLFTGLSLFSKVLPRRIHPLMICGWTVLTIALITALALTACCDPGIQYKVLKPPSHQENQWRWCDRAHSYRSRNAVYDVDTAVIVEGFDHTCPWTGTAIGKKNMVPFQAFVCLIFLCMMMNVLLLSGAFDVKVT